MKQIYFAIMDVIKKATKNSFIYNIVPFNNNIKNTLKNTYIENV